MGIFNKLAGLVSKKEKSEEEKLLIAVLINLKKALKSTEKTLKTLGKIQTKLVKGESLDEVNWSIINQSVKGGWWEIGIKLCGDNARYLNIIKEKIKAREAVSSYRRTLYSEKDRLLLHLVRKLLERNSEMKDYLDKYGYRKYFTSRNLLSKCKQAIEKSIKDLENYFASQK